MLFFFVGQVSRSGDMQEVRQGDFGGDNASGRVILNRVRRPEYSARNLYFSTETWKHFSHFALVCIQVPTLNARMVRLTVGNFEIN